MVISQFIINCIIASVYIFILAISFSLIFQTVRFFHFAHGAVFTMGAYLTYLFNVSTGLSLLISVVFAVIVCAFLGYLIELCLYRPLRNKGCLPLTTLLTSLGVYICIQNAISMIFGDATNSMRGDSVQKGFNLLGGRITSIQIVTVCISLFLVIALSIFLKKTIVGKSIRAVANDPMLADISGINSNYIILWVFAIGSALAGLAGILVAFDVDMTPTMGMHALLMGVVAVIIGGVNSISGIALGAFLLAISQHLGAWYIGSQWQDAIAFVILVLFLLFKPEGFFGKKVKSANV
jgi:branched-chain amino acid transport system permease protein